MAWLLLIHLHIYVLLKVLEQNSLWVLEIYQQFYYYSCLTSYLVPLSGPRRQNCPSTKKTPLREEEKKGCSAILVSPPSILPLPSHMKINPPKLHNKKEDGRKIFCYDATWTTVFRWGRQYRRSSCPAHFLVPYMVAYTHAICLRAECSNPVWPFTS